MKAHPTWDPICYWAQLLFGHSEALLSVFQSKTLTSVANALYMNISLAQRNGCLCVPHEMWPGAIHVCERSTWPYKTYLEILSENFLRKQQWKQAIKLHAWNQLGKKKEWHVLHQFAVFVCVPCCYLGFHVEDKTLFEASLNKLPHYSVLMCAWNSCAIILYFLYFFSF